MDTIQILWQRIETWMSTYAPQSRQRLLPGASETDIQRAEAAMGMMLPEDFKASYRLHNGGYALDAVSQMEILSLKDIISDWQMYKELEEAGTWDEAIPYYFTERVVASGWQTGPLQPVWWHLRWVPFGRDSAGNCCCLDLIPAPGGSVGQVIDWDHEAGPSRTLAASFQELLTNFADDLEAGKYVEIDDGLTRRSKV